MDVRQEIKVELMTPCGLRWWKLVTTPPPKKNSEKMRNTKGSNDLEEPTVLGVGKGR